MRTVAAVILVLAATPQTVRAAPALINCEKSPGFLGGPFVPDAKTAEEIYRAVAKSVAPGVLERYPLVVVSDDGGHWSVGQTRHDPPVKPKPGEAIVNVGGGQLSMKIEKCNGSISSAYFNR